MRICIYGAGAMGGYLGALLAESGIEVTLIARGAHLAAMQQQGLRVISGGVERLVWPRCTDDPGAAGEQDAVILALKAYSLASAAESMGPLLGPETMVVTAQNGVPWWYFHRHGGPLDGRRLACLDPDGRLWRSLAPERCIGCVLYPAAEIAAPGVVRHSFGNRVILGEPDGSDSRRCRQLANTMTAAGLDAPVHPNIRQEIWTKLWGNLSFNPLSVLTGGTLAEIAQDRGTRSVVRQMMAEAEKVAKTIGITFPVDIETRIERANSVGAHKSSMLQDYERGRPLEIDALLTAVIEIAQAVEADTPLLDTIHALLVQRARTAGCLPEQAY